MLNGAVVLRLLWRKDVTWTGRMCREVGLIHCRTSRKWVSVLEGSSDSTPANGSIY